MLGTLNILEAAADQGFEAFVHAGSSSEYGFKDHPPGENEWLEPNSYYAVGKAAATLLCRYVGEARRLRTATLRLYSVYGPWEEPGRLVPTLLCAALDGRLPPLVDPRVARDFVYVDDAVDAFVLAAEGAASGVYNIGSGRQTSLEALVQVARRIFAVDVEPEWGTMEKRSWDATVWVADPRRAQEELGWAAVAHDRRGAAVDRGLAPVDARDPREIRREPACATDLGPIRRRPKTPRGCQVEQHEGVGFAPLVAWPSDLRARARA